MSITRMVIGNTNSEATSTPNIISKIIRGARYYEDFETYLIAVLGFGHLVEASNNGKSSSYRSADSIRFDCKQSDGSWYWLPEPTVRFFSLNIAPTELFLQRNSGTQPEVESVLNLGSINQLMFNFGQALATNYFERLKPTVIQIYGPDPANWPSVWNFSRVVRNAMSHGGKISFQNTNASEVGWKHLNYSPADNGRIILHTDIWPGDIFDLIIDMDSNLY